MSLVYSNYYLTANARRSGSALNLRFGFSPSATSTETLYHLRSGSANLFNFCVNLDECPWAAKNGLLAWVSFTVDGTTVFDKTWFVPTGTIMTTSTVNYSVAGTTTLADMWEAFGSQASTAKTCRIVLQLHCTNGITHGGTVNAGYAASSTLKSYKDITFTARMYAASGASTSYVLYSPLTIKSETEVRGLEEFVPASVTSLFDSLKTHVTSEHRMTESLHTNSILGVRDSFEDSLVQLTAEVQGMSDEVEDIEEAISGLKEQVVGVGDAVSSVDGKIGNPGYYRGISVRPTDNLAHQCSLGEKRTLFGVLGQIHTPYYLMDIPDDHELAENRSYFLKRSRLASDKKYFVYDGEFSVADALGSPLLLSTKNTDSEVGGRRGFVGLHEAVGAPPVTLSSVEIDGVEGDVVSNIRSLFEVIGLSGFSAEDEATLLSSLQGLLSELAVVSNDSQTIVNNTQQVVTNIEQIADDNKKMVSALNLLFERIRVLLSQRNKKIL